MRQMTVNMAIKRLQRIKHRSGNLPLVISVRHSGQHKNDTFDNVRISAADGLGSPHMHGGHRVVVIEVRP